MSSRQTVSFLTRRFREVGLQPDSRHGQNFLIDMNLINLLVDSAKIESRDLVLEIGTGTGSLTSLIAPRAGHVITVEIDSHLHQLAREELEEFDNVTMLQQDALRNKNHFSDIVLETIQSEFSKLEKGRFKLVANLPYNVATPIISNLLLTEVLPTSMTVTIQKELADRIVARPRTKDYSALSIWMQSLCDCRLVRTMAPSVFWPRPKVHSAILHLEHNLDKRALITDIRFYHEFLRSLFFHRRKFLRSVVISSFKERLEKTDVDEVLKRLGHGPEARAEELPVDQIRELGEAFLEKVREVESGDR
ncbi:MAG: 16S rRNA (adenine(1518)-N(6)/adenine(1519)-N(6))-dimethyltransferase RsmA [Planctomycetota bacterium]|nr:16S rRNA (adenine(1518)-N(6)/adenine(1519)-N(6))-dimethyltransferase RsmA [Planctomycetota bacterium]